MALNLASLKTRVILDNLSGHPDGIAVDAAENRIYWTNMGALKEPASLEFFQADGSLESCRLDGSERQLLVGNGLFVTGKQLVHDKDNAHLYWCDREGMRIFRANEDGRDPRVLVQRGVFPKDAKDYSRHCVGIAIDPRNNALYWTQKGPAKGGKGRIFRAKLALPSGQSPEHRDDIQVLAENLPEPIDLALNADGSKIYWTDRGADAAGGNSLNSADIREGTLVNRRLLARGFKEAIALAIDPAEEQVYITDLAGQLYRHRLDQPGSLEILARFGPLTGATLVSWQ